MPYATARDGTKLYVKDWGRGRPIVLIHGWPLSSDSWDPVAVPLVEAGNRIIAYDRRGFGRSDQPWDGYDYDTFTDDLASVIEAAGVQDGITLVGFSMGGGEVVRYMSKHQGRGVDRIALISSIVPYLLRTDDNPNGAPQSTFDDMTEQLRDDRAAFLQTFFRSFYGVGVISQPVSSGIIDNSFQVAMQAGLRPTLAAQQAFSTTDFRQDLAAIKVPTLVIHGTSDATVPIDPTARVVAREIPSARLIEYDGSPHGVFASDRERLTRDLLDFIDGNDASTTTERERVREDAY